MNLKKLRSVLKKEYADSYDILSKNKIEHKEPSILVASAYLKQKAENSNTAKSIYENFLESVKTSKDIEPFIRSVENGDHGAVAANYITFFKNNWYVQTISKCFHGELEDLNTHLFKSAKEAKFNAYDESAFTSSLTDGFLCRLKAQPHIDIKDPDTVLEMLKTSLNEKGFHYINYLMAIATVFELKHKDKFLGEFLIEAVYENLKKDNQLLPFDRFNVYGGLLVLIEYWLVIEKNKKNLISLFTEFNY